jgi:hypothetical protein
MPGYELINMISSVSSWSRKLVLASYDFESSVGHWKGCFGSVLGSNSSPTSSWLLLINFSELHLLICRRIILSVATKVA